MVHSLRVYDIRLLPIPPKEKGEFIRENEFTILARSRTASVETDTRQKINFNSKTGLMLSFFSAHLCLPFDMNCSSSEIP